MLAWVGTALVVSVLGCGGGGTGGDPLEPDPEVAPFVGDWQAQVMLITSVANPEVVEDPLAQGATFTLNVQPSGHYTAILLFVGTASTEIGTISVSGSTLTLHRSFPTTATTPGIFEFHGANRFTLDGDTEFDFNDDGTAEPALAHFDLVRR